MANNKNRGVLHFVIYKDPKDTMYTAVCLDFDIVEQGKDISKLKKSIEEAAYAYLETVLQENLPTKLLNRTAPQSYWKRAFELMKNMDDYMSKGSDAEKEPAVRDLWMRNPQELQVA